MSDAKDIAQKINTLTAGVDLADEAAFETLMEQITPLIADAGLVDSGMPSEVMEAFDALLQAQSIAIQKQMGMSDEEIAASDQMMADYAEKADAERQNTPAEVSAIFDAIERGDVAALTEALPHVDINVRLGEYEQTPLYGAMSSFDLSPEIIKLLLDQGADPSQGLAGNSSVLHGMAFATYCEWPQDDVNALVARCVGAGASLEQRTDDLGWTPLHTAVSESNEKVSRAFLENGADPNVLMGKTEPPTFNNGGTALQMVQSRPELVELLLSFGADPLKPNAYGQTSIDAVRVNAQDDSSFGQDCVRSLALMEARVALS